MCSCDCYVLKDILQNWSDEDAVLILGNLYDAISPGSRLLVVETVQHTGSHSEEKVGVLPRPRVGCMLIVHDGVDSVVVLQQHSHCDSVTNPPLGTAISL